MATRPGKPIWIILNTPGGSATECFAICDLMRAIIKNRTPLYVLGIGCVASAGVAIMQMASERYSLPNTQFLVHQASRYLEAGSEETSQGEERVEELKRKNKIFLSMISERSGMSLEDLASLAKKTDHWLDAKTAKGFGQNGLIDKIVEEFPFQL